MQNSRTREVRRAGALSGPNELAGPRLQVGAKTAQTLSSAHVVSLRSRRNRCPDFLTAENGRCFNEGCSEPLMNKQTKSRKLTANQSARLSAYFVAGVAASMAAASEAEAAIVYFPVDPAKVVGPNVGDFITFSSINLQDATYQYNQYFITNPAFTLFLEAQSNVWGFGNNDITFAIVGPLPPPPGYYSDYAAIRFNLNDPISGSLVFGNQAKDMKLANGWLPGTTGYVGLQMDLGGQLHYGWARLNYGLNIDDPVTISGFAFQSDPNVTILAGDTGGGPAPIPEPGTWAAAALLAGGAAFARWRKRRDGTQKEAA